MQRRRVAKTFFPAASHSRLCSYTVTKSLRWKPTVKNSGISTNASKSLQYSEIIFNMHHVIAHKSDEIRRLFQCSLKIGSAFLLYVEKKLVPDKTF